MQAKPTHADFLAVQMAVMTQLIVHLDERGRADGQAFLIELLQIGRALPAGQGAVLDELCRNLQSRLEASRERRQPPTGDKH